MKSEEGGEDRQVQFFKASNAKNLIQQKLRQGEEKEKVDDVDNPIYKRICNDECC